MSVCVVSLPRLKELDWRVDMIASSDSVSRMSVPTCLVQFKVTSPKRVGCPRHLLRHMT